MTLQSRAKIAIFKAQTQDKIATLLTEFSEGKISREQFHAVYAHYNAQLELAEVAEHMNAASALDDAQGKTIGIRQAHMGKAIGLIIYHNRSGRFVETMGAFDVAPSRLATTLNDFTQLMAEGKLIDRRIEKCAEKRWLLFAAGQFTTVITLFHHEPANEQSREIERLHHDFETANRHLLADALVDGRALAYPFLVFVQQKLRKA